MKNGNRLSTVVSMVFVTLVASLVAAPAASANVGQYECDDGGGGITGHTSSSQCAQYYGYYPASYPGCPTSISDEPSGAVDTITVSCGWGWVTPPWYVPFPPLPPAAPLPPCSYASTAATDGPCGVDGPLDTPASRQALLDLLNGHLVAGAGAAPLGSHANPVPIRTDVQTPPPTAPHIWRNRTVDEAGQSAIVGCGAGGGFGAAIGTILKPGWGTAAGLLAGCGAGAATSYGALLYKSAVRTWYPLGPSGEPSGNPADWYTCTDVRVVPATASSWNPLDVTHFRYPPEYPDIGGTVQPFARVCVPFKI